MKITIILDFVCPYCFVGIELLEKALKEKHIKVEFRFLPYELNPSPKPQPTVSNLDKVYFDKNIGDWAKEQQVTINFPSVNPKPRTALAFEGLYIAEKYNAGEKYVKSVLEAYWIHNKDIGKIDVLMEIAGNLLIPEFEFSDALFSGTFREAHVKLNEQVSNMDFEVVPTFYLNDSQLPEFPKTVSEWLKIFEKK